MNIGVKIVLLKLTLRLEMSIDSFYPWFRAKTKRARSVIDHVCANTAYYSRALSYHTSIWLSYMHMSNQSHCLLMLLYKSHMETLYKVGK